MTHPKQPAPGRWERYRVRIRGLPRSARELSFGLQLLGILRTQGWQQSVSAGGSVGPDGTPLPWYCYPAIEWLGPRLLPTDRVFEYGCGNSTLWYAARVARVEAVDHDAHWAERLIAQLPENASVRHVPAAGNTFWAPDASAYPASIAEAEGKFDLIAVDGVERCSCLLQATGFLKPSGAILIDNSDRPEMRETLRDLTGRGFLRLDFVGIGPVLGVPFGTSLLFTEPRRWLGAQVDLDHHGS